MKKQNSNQNVKVEKMVVFVKNLVKTENCQFKLKFGTLTNSDMQNSIVMFTFSLFNQKYLFGQIWSKKLKLSVRAVIWYLD